MTIDNKITEEDLISYAANEKTIATKYQESTDSIGHKIWEMANYANTSFCNYFGITHADVDNYRQEHSTQLELDFDNNTKDLYYKNTSFGNETYERFTHDD